MDGNFGEFEADMQMLAEQAPGMPVDRYHMDSIGQPMEAPAHTGLYRAAMLHYFDLPEGEHAVGDGYVVTYTGRRPAREALGLVLAMVHYCSWYQLTGPGDGRGIDYGLLEQATGYGAQLVNSLLFGVLGRGVDCRRGDGAKDSGRLLNSLVCSHREGGGPEDGTHYLVITFTPQYLEAMRGLAVAGHYGLWPNVDN